MLKHDLVTEMLNRAQINFLKLQHRIMRPLLPHIRSLARLSWILSRTPNQVIKCTIARVCKTPSGPLVGPRVLLPLSIPILLHDANRLANLNVLG